MTALADYAPAGVVSRCQTCRADPAHEGQCPSCDGGWVTEDVTEEWCPSMESWVKLGTDCYDGCSTCGGTGKVKVPVPPWARVVCPGDTMLMFPHNDRPHEGQVVGWDEDEGWYVKFAHPYDDFYSPRELYLVISGIGDNPYRKAAGLVP